MENREWEKKQELWNEWREEAQPESYTRCFWSRIADLEAEIVERVLAASGGAVLDVGSCETWFYDSLKVKPSWYRAVDPEAPKDAQPKGRATAVYGVAEDLPAAAHSTRIVLYRSSMDHFLDIAKSLEEARRVLEKDGLLLISLSNKNAALRWVRWVRNTLKKKPHYNHLDQHMEWYTPKMVAEILQEAGFDVVDQRGVGFIPFTFGKETRRSRMLKRFERKLGKKAASFGDAFLILARRKP